MRRLREQVAEYLRVRRSLGYKLVEHERFLNQFLDYLEQEQATTITAANALAWAKLPAGVSPRWHGARLSAIRGFAAWAQAFDPDIQVPPAGLLPMRATRATPYLYSEDQIGALMNAAATLVPALRAVTFQTLIGLLAVTGMRAGEAIRAASRAPHPPPPHPPRWGPVRAALLGAPDRTTWTGRRDHAWILLAVTTGLRVSELTALTRGDLNLDTGPHVLCHGKGRKDRTTPLTAETVADLRTWTNQLPKQTTTALFPTRAGRPGSSSLPRV